MLRSSYVIIVMHIYMLKKLYQQNEYQPQQKQKMLIKKKDLKNVLNLLIAMSEINNTQLDNTKYIALVMTMYNLIEHSNNYSKTSGSLW